LRIVSSAGILGGMSSVSPIDPEFPGVAPEVVERYRNAPDNVVAEILDGELSLMARPRPRHTKAAARFASALGSFHDPDDGDPGGWVVLIEPELRLGPRPDVIDPDLAGWRVERLPEEPETAAVHVAPDWVCEILSDSTEAMDRGPKRRIYRREGVGHLWLCDPRIETLEVYRLEGGRWLELETFEGDAKVRADPFDAIELDLSRVWRWAAPRG
jgi:Uma2 family endonuclease